MSVNTYTERQKELAVRKTKRSNTITTEDIPNGDYREVISTKELAVAFETTTEDIEVVKGNVRNTKKVITSIKGKITSEEEMGDGYSNGKLALIEATLGKIITPDKDIIDTGLNIVIDTALKTITVPHQTTNIIPAGRDNILVSFYRFGQKPLSVFYIVKEEHIVGVSTTYTYLAGVDTDDIQEALTNYPTETFFIKPLLGIDFDADVEPVDMIFKQGLPNSKWSNNPDYYGRYYGDDIKKLGNGVGTAEIITESLKRMKLKTIINFPVADYVNPSPKLLEQIINFNTNATTHDGSIFWQVKRQNGEEINGSLAVAGGLNDTDTELGLLATNIQTALNLLPNNTSTVSQVGSTIVFTDSVVYYQELIITMTPVTTGESVVGSGTMKYIFNEDDVWEKCTVSEFLDSKNTPMAGDRDTSSTIEEVAIDFNLTAGTFNQGDKIYLYVNGIEYVVILPTDVTTAYDIATEFSNMINANTDLYLVGSTVASGVLNIKATNFYRLVNCELFIEQGSNSTGLSFTINKIVESDAREISENGYNFVLEKFYLGDFDNEMIDFCNLASIKIDFNRELKDIPCIKRENGIVGVDASAYTIFADVEFIDQDAYEKFKQWAMFRDQQVIRVYAVDPRSGFAFYGQKVLVENFEEMVKETLLGRKIRLNLNYDPNSNFELSLPQFLQSSKII